MGAGLLPTAIHNNKLYFLFGKENKYEDTSPGWADFGGGTDNNETLLETSIREGTEELTGFIGSSNDIKQMIKKSGTYNVDYVNPNKNSGYIEPIFCRISMNLYCLIIITITSGFYRKNWTQK